MHLSHNYYVKHCLKIMNKNLKKLSILLGRVTDCIKLFLQGFLLTIVVARFSLMGSFVGSCGQKYGSE